MINLQGFTSTTLSAKKGLEFALGDDSDLNINNDDDKSPVLFKIDFQGSN